MPTKFNDSSLAISTVKRFLGGENSSGVHRLALSYFRLFVFVMAGQAAAAAALVDEYKRKKKKNVKREKN